MKTLLAIKKFEGEKNTWLNPCHMCNKNIEGGSHYIKYGQKYGANTFHLTCFNKMEQKELKKADLCSNNININLKRIEDFKKRITLKKFKPMIVNNIIKNIGNFKMDISDRFYNQNICDQCGKRIDKGDIYVNHGTSIVKAYHFICFQEAAKSRLNKWNTYKIEVQQNIKKLEPYKSEMICESLETQ